MGLLQSVFFYGFTALATALLVLVTQPTANSWQIPKGPSGPACAHAVANGEWTRVAGLATARVRYAGNLRRGIAISVAHSCAQKAHIGIGSGVPASVPARS